MSFQSALMSPEILYMFKRGGLGTTVKLLSRDWKVKSSSPGNSLFRKKQGNTAYSTLKWWDPFPDPAYPAALVPGYP